MKLLGWENNGNKIKVRHWMRVIWVVDLGSRVNPYWVWIDGYRPFRLGEEWAYNFETYRRLIQAGYYPELKED